MGVLFAVIAVVLVLAVGAGGTLLVGRSQLDAPGGSTASPVTITVTSGESLDNVVGDLASHGVIRSRFWFLWYAKFEGLAARLVAGRFQLNGGMSASYVIQALEGTPVVAVTHALLLPEGLSAAQMADRVGAAGLGITAAQYLAEVTGGSFSEPFLAGRPPGSSLEGFLFPDTYNIPDHSTAHDIVQLQLADFARRAMPLFGGMTPQQVYARVTVASIVEREARFDVDRPLVASVIDNRLAIGMALQVDSSVLYGLGLTSGLLTPARLQQDTPYNTYLHAGLPPTPIANPGFSSLQAAAHPAPTGYYYFVSDACGHNHYSATVQEHNRQVSEYIDQPCPSPS